MFFLGKYFQQSTIRYHFSNLGNSYMPRVLRLMLVAISSSILVPNMSLILFKTYKYEDLISLISQYLLILIVSFPPNGIFIIILLLDMHKLHPFYMHKLDSHCQIKANQKSIRLKRCNSMGWDHLGQGWLIMLILLHKSKLFITWLVIRI